MTITLPGQQNGHHSSYNKRPLPRRTTYGPQSPAMSSNNSNNTVLYRQPGAPLAGSQPVGRLMELRLMHQFTTHTYKTLSVSSCVSTPVLEDVWRVAVPDLAFTSSPHLVDALLAVSALHLRSTWPKDPELVRASHAYMASSLAEYSNSLKSGINGANAETLFITSALIAFQSTATRIFTKDESASQQGIGVGDTMAAYQPPLSWFHSFQGVKTVVAASWQWLKHSGVILSIIDSQPVLDLNFAHAHEGFFGHLLDGLEEELAELSATTGNGAGPSHAGSSNNRNGQESESQDIVTATRQAYQHAVATLNWAHKIASRGALAFPASVSKRFVELMEERCPRALAILASFFALLKAWDNVWWLHGMARREVLGIVSLFNSDYFGHDIERKWWPHLEWAVRIALYTGSGENSGYIPAEIWGSSWPEENPRPGSHVKFTSHIEMFSQILDSGQALPPPPAEPT